MIKKILLPTDFSDASKKALDYATFIADKFEAELHIAYVIFDETKLTTFYVPKGNMKEFLVNLENAAQESLDEFISENLKTKESKHVLLKGVPYVEILKYIEENDIDMVITGTYEKSNLEQIIYGSTTDKVVKKAKCPVLIVKL